MRTRSRSRRRSRAGGRCSSADEVARCRLAVPMPEPVDEFPRQIARTRGFSLGVPRSFTVSPDGERIAYLRTKSGGDPVSCLWVFDVSGAKERLVFDPGQEEAERDLSDAERARRERMRER